MIAQGYISSGDKKNYSFAQGLDYTLRIYFYGREK